MTVELVMRVIIKQKIFPFFLLLKSLLKQIFLFMAPKNLLISYKKHLFENYFSFLLIKIVIFVLK